MSFNIRFTHRALRVEGWINRVKDWYLDKAPVKVVGLDCEFTDAPRNTSQHKLPDEKRQRAAVLQLAVADQVLVFQICACDRVPELLKQFLMDEDIKFCGAAIHNDQRMLLYYGITIRNPVNLQQVLPNPTKNTTPSLFALSNPYLGTNLSKDAPEIKAVRETGWDSVPLSFEKVTYAALDARIGFELARKFWQLHGYNRVHDINNVYEFFILFQCGRITCDWFVIL